ncbi:neuromedin-U isoform X2 [Xenopus laevis]|uniref:Neuromedin-U isoform X2 n=1 Tax=Xenopus laevis TaxID=8355 RepID=A0A8J1MV42_XENLA|nr:neuromedin-U isoform X2 [Xenopus laevis]
MLAPNRCNKLPALQYAATQATPQSCHQLHSFKWQPPSWLLCAILLVSWASSCKGFPLSPNALQEQELQLWNQLGNDCSAILSDSQSLGPSTLEELCVMIMGILQKSQGSDEKEESKRSSVLHPLLQLVPQLHDRRMKRFKAEEEVQGPGLSRGYFLFRPRNGRRSAIFR